MGRPPIIISNGGVVEALAKGLAEIRDSKTIEKTIIDNIIDLNARSKDTSPNFDKRPIIREIISDNKKEDPTILWCLADEDKKYLKGKLKDWGVKDNQAELSG